MKPFLPNSKKTTESRFTVKPNKGNQFSFDSESLTGVKVQMGSYAN